MDPGVCPLREVAENELYKRTRATAKTRNVGIFRHLTSAYRRLTPGAAACRVPGADSQALDPLSIHPHPVEIHLAGELEDAGLGDAAELAIPQRDVIDRRLWQSLRIQHAH